MKEHHGRLTRRAGPAIFLCLAAAFLVFGCASRKQMADLQEDMWYVRTSVDSLKSTQRAMQDSLCSIQEQVRDVKAQSAFGSTALENRMSELAARLDDIVGRMDRTLAPLEEFLRKQTSSDTSGKVGGTGVDVYDAAMRDLSSGNYDLAEVGFLQFLDTNPKSDLADDARYGLAETYYARKRYDEAIIEYQKVTELSPQGGGKAPAALLKIGLCQQAKGSDREARRTWQDLMKRFPASDEARVAKQRLDEMKEKR
jgi:tol-pal system protein YbgF